MKGSTALDSQGPLFLLLREAVTGGTNIKTVSTVQSITSALLVVAHSHTHLSRPNSKRIKRTQDSMAVAKTYLSLDTVVHATQRYRPFSTIKGSTETPSLTNGTWRG